MNVEKIIRAYPEVDVYEIKVDVRRMTYTVSGRIQDGGWFESDPLPVESPQEVAR